MRLGRHVFFRRQLTGKNPLHPRGLTNPASHDNPLPRRDSILTLFPEY